MKNVVYKVLKNQNDLQIQCLRFWKFETWSSKKILMPRFVNIIFQWSKLHQFSKCQKICKKLSKPMSVNIKGNGNFPIFDLVINSNKCHSTSTSGIMIFKITLTCSYWHFHFDFEILQLSFSLSFHLFFYTLLVYSRVVVELRGINM